MNRSSQLESEIMQYACLKAQRFATEDGYAIVPLRQEDIQNIRAWRNAQIDFLRQHTALTPQEQDQYYNDSIVPSFSQQKPRLILFSFLKDEVCIGYGGLVHVDWQASRAEVSFLLNPGYFHKHEELFQHFYDLMKFVAFKDLKFHRLFTETFAFRTNYFPLIEKAGFRLEGRLREHVFKRDQWHDSIIHGLLAKECEITFRINPSQG